MFSTNRAIVDDEGTIRLLEPVKLKEGTHVLVIVVDRDTLIWLIRSKTQPTQKSSFPKCLCGCGEEKSNPKSKFIQSHDGKLTSTFSKIKRGELDANAIPRVLIEAAQNNSELMVLKRYTAEDILEMAGVNRGAVVNDATRASYAMSTYRATVDDKGIIRPQEHVKLKEGTHILVTLADKDSLIAPMRSSGRTALSEERLREELQEDEAWAYLLKEVQL